jgi:hypothetical protein
MYICLLRATRGVRARICQRLLTGYVFVVLLNNRIWPLAIQSMVVYEVMLQFKGVVQSKVTQRMWTWRGLAFNFAHMLNQVES